MELYDKLINKEAEIAVVGLGYVGLPLAVAFADKVRTIGFDVNEEKIALYRSGLDPTEEVGPEKIAASAVDFTSDEQVLRRASFIIIAVPTPVKGDESPDLSPVVSASELVGRNLRSGSIVVFESTVYPGVTEEVCVPLLEKESGLVCGCGFKVAYSPERINPGDKVHRLENIVKIVSGMDKETLDSVAAVYGLIIHAGVYRAENIKVAEAAKLMENSQRDINIAFMNEFAIVCSLMGINSKSVIEAMNTKWNALGFYPGLVGGHCIGVDPYYFLYKAKMLGYHSQIIAAGRKINNSMASYVADNIVKNLILADIRVRHAKIYVFGITFKEDCPDVRNSKAYDVLRRLAEYRVEVKVVDPAADKAEAKAVYGVDIIEMKEVKDADCLVFLVEHKEFKALSEEELAGFYKAGASNESRVLIDAKSIFPAAVMRKAGYTYWNL